MDPRERIAKRIAREMKDGDYVNLGIGLPTLCASYVPAGIDITLHSENGLLGVGPYPLESELDPDLINAGKETVTETPGSSYFNSADSFAMVRGGHIDLTVLGALEVAQNGDLANWMIPGKKVKGMGGAMDLVAGAKRVIVITTHLTKGGGPKLRSACTLPLTGRACVDAVMTDYGWFDIEDGRMVLREIAPDLTVAQVRAATEAEFTASDDLKPVAT